MSAADIAAAVGLLLAVARRAVKSGGRKLELRERRAPERLINALELECHNAAASLLRYTYRANWSEDTEALSAKCWIGERLVKSLFSLRGEEVGEMPYATPIRSWCMAQSLTDSLGYSGSAGLSIAVSDAEFARASLVPFRPVESRLQEWLAGANVLARARCATSPWVVAPGEVTFLRATKQRVESPCDGVVTQVSAQTIHVRPESGFRSIFRSGDHIAEVGGTEIGAGQSKVLVRIGETVSKGQALATSDFCDDDCLALGRTLRVAFMHFHGYTARNGAVISRSAARLSDLQTIRRTRVNVRFGDEDDSTPTEPREMLLAVDVGQRIHRGDVIAIRRRKSTVLSEISPEALLLDAMLTGKVQSADYWDRRQRETQIRAPHGAAGILNSVNVFRDAVSGRRAILELIDAPPVDVGDELASRHGRGLVISAILPDEDMPVMPDGSSVDLVISPQRVTRDELKGELLEARAGQVASELNCRLVVGEDGWAARRDLHTFGTLADIVTAARAFDLNLGRPLEEVLDRIHTSQFAAVRGDSFFTFEARGLLNECDVQLKRLILSGDQPLDRRNLERWRAANSPLNRVRAVLGRAGEASYWLKDGRTGDEYDLPISAGRLYVAPTESPDSLPEARAIGPVWPPSSLPIAGGGKPTGQFIDGLALLSLASQGARYCVSEFLGPKSSDAWFDASTAYEQIVRTGCLGESMNPITSDFVDTAILLNGHAISTKVD